MSEFKLTDSQQEVISSDNNSLLVSASAGSGKTATVIQKILDLIVNKNVDISELLVITFTESASLEMKVRLKENLIEALKNLQKNVSKNFTLENKKDREDKENLENVDNTENLKNVNNTENLENEENTKIKETEEAKVKRIKNLIDSLPTSDISTIHGFCSKCLRKFFYVLDLNPSFIVLDEKNANFLKATAIDKVIKNYSKNQDREFISLTQIFGGGRNLSSFKKNVLELQDFLCSIDDKDKFIKETSKLCYDEDISKNEGATIINNYILSNIYFITSSLNNFLQTAKSINSEKFINFILNLLNAIKGIDYKNNFIKNRIHILEVELPKFNFRKFDDYEEDLYLAFKPFFEEVKAIILDLKKMVINRDLKELIEEIKDSKTKLLKLLEVENAYNEEYFKLKEKRNSLDFNDLEKYFLKLLENKDVKDAISSSYKYIFVDEYQDINDVQESILTKLTKNKIVMVGDVKQSIYGFRNSSPNIFVNKSKIFNEDLIRGKLINLNENFRSSKEILEFINAIFKKCMTKDFGGVDYEKDAILDGKAEYENCSDEPKISLNILSSEEVEGEEENFTFPYSVLEDKNKYDKELSNARCEAMIVANKILKLINKNYYDIKTKSIKKIKFSDIAILSRNNEFLKQVSKVLLEYKIPINLNISENIYKNADVFSLLSLLKVINNSHDDISLSVALTGFLGAFTFDELALIRNQYFDEEYFYESVDKFLNEDFSLTESLKNLQDKLKAFFSEISNLREMTLFYSIGDILNYLQIKYDFLSYFKALPDGENRYKILKNYLDSFDESIYDYDLVKYLDYVESFSKDSLTSTAFSSSPNSIKMLTIHSSKGLEFPIVFLVGTGQSFSSKTFKEEILKDKDLGLGLYSYNLENLEKKETLARNAITINLKAQEKAEELRLLYVALTRAKNHLIITGSKNLDKICKINSFVEARAVHSFLDWILVGLSDIGFKSLKLKNVFFDKNKNYELEVNVYKKDDFEVNSSNKVDLIFKKEDFIEAQKLIKSFNFKYNGVNNLALKNTVSSMLQEYLEGGECINLSPKKLSIFEDKKEDIDASRLGTYYHKIMQKVDFNCKDCDSLNLINQNILDLVFEKKYIDKIDANKIKKCIEKIKNLNIKTCLKEQPFLSYLPYNFIFKGSDIDDKILIQGVADLLVLTQGGWNLIDYKITKAKNKNQLVEKYSLQLKLYKLCLEKAMDIKIEKILIYSFFFDDFIEII